MTGSAAANPFEVKKLNGPTQPLCPWRYPEHEAWYVDLDHTEEAYEEFQRQAETLGSPDEDEGKLLLVTGDTGCGKTAVANRCLGWLKESSKERFTVEIVDARSALLGAVLPVNERLTAVCDYVVGQLERKNFLNRAELNRLVANRIFPGRVFPHLGPGLIKGLVMVILLPSTEVPEEVIRYGGWVPERTLFVMESAHFDDKDLEVINNRLKDYGRLIHVHVGALKKGDFARFANDRLKRHAPTGGYPRMSEKTLQSLEGRSRSVSQMQIMLHGTYELLKTDPLEYGRTLLVTEEHISEFQNREARRGRPGGRR
jgi:energy-coupling factor transporter ATP-binding protein EcfA2